MPATTTRRRLLPTALITAAATAAMALPALAAPADAAAAEKAARYLVSTLTEAGTVVESYPGANGAPVLYTDYGRTLDVALALIAAGGHDAKVGVTLSSVTDQAAIREYTQGAPGDRADAAYAGATAKLAFLIELAGGDATSVAGINLLNQLLSLVTEQGRLADRSEFGNYANLFGHAFAILAIDSSGRRPSEALVQGLLAAPCEDGSFPQEYEPKDGAACTGQVDATGLVLQALAGIDLGSSEAAQRAATWLQGQQKSDGSFPGEAPVNSTGYAVMGLNALDAPIGEALGYLVSQQNSDGGLRRGAGESTASDAFATAQALPALAGQTFQRSARTVPRRPVPCGDGAVTSLPRSTITATEFAKVRVRATSGSTVDLLAYSRPNTSYRKVRTGLVGKDGFVTFDVRPGTNTRLYAHQRNCNPGASQVLLVKSLHQLSVARNGTRTYTFSGKVIPTRPGGVVVSLYRITADGKSVLTAQVRTNATTGAWSVRRTFSGGGRFGFVSRTGGDLQNAAGSSPVRSVLVY